MQAEYNSTNQLTETVCVSLLMSNAPKCTDLAAVILCGGQSTRMGVDKATVVFGHETLLQRVCRLTLTTAAPVVVVAAGNQQLPELPNGVMVARDLFPNAGPLAGLLTGLKCLRDQLPMRWPELMIWASTCDAPFVNASVIRHLQQRLAESAACPLVAVTHEGKQNPFVAVYRSSLLQSMAAQFEAGERKAQALLQHPHAILIDSGELAAIDPEFLFLRNINDNQQLAEARMRLDIPHNN